MKDQPTESNRIIGKHKTGSYGALDSTQPSDNNANYQAENSRVSSYTSYVSSALSTAWSLGSYIANLGSNDNNIITISAEDAQKLGANTTAGQKFRF